VFSKSANPLDLPEKSTIRALFKIESVDPETYSLPSSPSRGTVYCAVQGQVVVIYKSMDENAKGINA